MQIMIDTATDTAETLYRLSTFLRSISEVVPVAPGEAGTTINGPTEPVELKHEPDFKPSDSLPPDNVDKGVKLAPMIPPPPGFTLPPPNIGINHGSLIFAAPVAATSAPMIPPPPGVPAPGPEFDSKGVQWSAALHTSTKTKTIDGQWKPRTKRGAKVDTVPADTMGKTSIQGVEVPAGQLAAAIEAFAGPQVLIPPPPVVAPPAVEDDTDVSAEDDTATAVDFPTFISNITAGMNAGTVTQKQIDEVQTAHGLSNLFSLSTATPELLATVSAAFGF